MNDYLVFGCVVWLGSFGLLWSTVWVGARGER